MYKLWIIDSNNERFNMYKESIELGNLKNHIELKYFTCLLAAHQCDEYPDFILVDFGALTYNLNCINKDLLINFFLQTKNTAIFGVQSAVKYWADDIIKEICKNYCDSVLIDYVNIDGKSVCDWLIKYINIFGEKRFIS